MTFILIEQKKAAKSLRGPFELGLAKVYVNTPNIKVCVFVLKETLCFD